MSQYTTGELAKLCNTTVRTVQFYDAKNLLKPSSLTEGGRRLYTEGDLRRLRSICLLKTLGLSLDSIRGVLESPNAGKVLLLLLAEQDKQLDAELEERRRQKASIALLRKSIHDEETLSVESIGDMEARMNNQKKMFQTRATMLCVGIVMDVIEVWTLIHWINTGVWWPFAAGMIFVLAGAYAIMKFYYRRTMYICPECNTVFKPGLKEFFFARHTLKTRRLTCTACHQKNFCVETAGSEETK